MEHSLLALMERHTRLDAIFLEHQTAILDRDLKRAAEALSRYSDALAAHMREEEEILLPLYSAKAPQPAGGGTQMFLDEHRKLRALGADLATALASATAEPRSILKLLDQETQYKGLLDHHDRRERAFLYPGLDAVTTPDERRGILDRLGLLPAGG